MIFRHVHLSTYLMNAVKTGSALLPSLRIRISFCFWATELDLGLSSMKSFSSSIFRQRARYFRFKLDILCELESPAHSHNRARFPFIPLGANRARFLFLALGCKSSSNRTLSSSANSDSQFSVEGRVETPFKFISPVTN